MLSVFVLISKLYLRESVGIHLSESRSVFVGGSRWEQQAWSLPSLQISAQVDFKGWRSIARLWAGFFQFFSLSLSLSQLVGMRKGEFEA